MNKKELCKIRHTHRRLNEAHLLWHQANEKYFNPEGFRININAAIQALRNLTFALQNEKSAIPDFTSWYESKQTELKEDKIMKWLCDARTEIVHKKDLEFYSEATVTIYSYETILKAKANVPIFASGKQLLQYMADENIIDEQIANMDVYASVERVWRVSEFPESDLLYLVAYGIGKLYELVKEAHEIVGTNIISCDIAFRDHTFDVGDNNIPICMENELNNRKELMDLKDFISRQMIIQEVEFSQKSFDEVKKRYSKIIRKLAENSIKDPYEYADLVVDISKQLLVNDKYHIALLCYRDGDMKWNMIQPVFEDQTSKFMFWQEFSKTVRKENINTMIFTSEAWVGTMDELISSGKRASEQKEKTEALLTNVFVKNDKSISYSTPFSRGFYGRIKLGETIISEEDSQYSGFFAPVLKVWNE
jgi:hypothetical protein